MQAGFLSLWKALCVCNCLEMGTLEMEPTWHRTCGDVAWGAHNHHLLSFFWLCPYQVFFSVLKLSIFCGGKKRLSPKAVFQSTAEKDCRNRLEAQVIPKIIGLIFVLWWLHTCSAQVKTPSKFISQLFILLCLFFSCLKLHCFNMDMAFPSAFCFFLAAHFWIGKGQKGKVLWRDMRLNKLDAQETAIRWE